MIEGSLEESSSWREDTRLRRELSYLPLFNDEKVAEYKLFSASKENLTSTLRFRFSSLFAFETHVVDKSLLCIGHYSNRKLHNSKIRNSDKNQFWIIALALNSTFCEGFAPLNLDHQCFLSHASPFEHLHELLSILQTQTHLCISVHPIYPSKYALQTQNKAQ